MKTQAQTEVDAMVTDLAGPTVRPNLHVPLMERVRVALQYAEAGHASSAADQLRHAIAEEDARATIAKATGSAS